MYWRAICSEHLSHCTSCHPGTLLIDNLVVTSASQATHSGRSSSLNLSAPHFLKPRPGSDLRFCTAKKSSNLSDQATRSLPQFRIPNSALRIRVACSAGTYIRTLAEDIGREVGLGAHLTELRRTRAGRFTIEQAVTLDQLQESSSPTYHLRPVEEAVEHLPEFVLRDDRVSKTLSGMSTRDLSGTFTDGQKIRMTAPTGDLIAIGFFDEADKVVQPKVVLG